MLFLAELLTRHVDRKGSWVEVERTPNRDEALDCLVKQGKEKKESSQAAPLGSLLVQ
jgi:hypothetical protein